jgi:hypothetical protein
MTDTAQLTGAGWIMLGLGAALGVLGLLVSLRTPSEVRLIGWARRYELDLTPGNRPVIARYLRVTRVLQIAGATTGWLSSPLYVGISGRPFLLGDSWVALALGGYLLGAVIAELLVARAHLAPPGIRLAALTPRVLSDYIPAATSWSLRILPAVTVVLAAAYAAIPKDHARTIDGGLIVVGAASILTVAFAVGVEWILRRIVARPQPVVAADLIAADDAIRASSIHTMSAAAIALLLLSAGWMLVSAGTVSSSGALGQGLLWAGLVTDVAAVAAWAVLAHPRNWRVHRSASFGGAR